MNKLKRVLTGMKQRCRNPNSKSYPNYGGRGISVCNEWNDSNDFISWALANGYKDGLTIERKDNDGNYEPSNCTFVTRVKNLENRRNSISNRFTEQEIIDIADEYITTNISYNDTLSKFKISGTSLRSILNGRKKQDTLTREAYGRHIHQYTTDGQYIASFNTIKSAQNQTGAGHITECAKGIYSQSGGFMWTYEKRRT